MTAQDKAEQNGNTEDSLKEHYENILLSQESAKSLVLSYLLHNCYASTVHCFRETIGDPALERQNSAIMKVEGTHDIGPAATLEVRKRLFDALVGGRVMEAAGFYAERFGFAQEGDSEIDMHVNFLLSGQIFIELLRQSSSSALEYAHIELGKFANLRSQKYRQELHDLVSLLAYPDPSSSPLSHYLSQSRREWVATQLNNHILTRSGTRTVPILEKIVRQSTVVRNLLQSTKRIKGGKDKVSFPPWDLKDFLSN